MTGSASPPAADVGSISKIVVNPLYRIRCSRLFNSLHKYVEVTVIGAERSMTRPASFVSAFLKRVMFFSYRNCFRELPNGDSTDVGWGCLLRAAQMLMSAALLRSSSSDGQIPLHWLSERYVEVEQLFMDRPDAPLGIHRLVSETHHVGVPYSSFVGPSAAADALTTACDTIPLDVTHFRCMKDSAVRREQIMLHLESHGAVLLLIPLMFGYESVTTLYQDALLAIIKLRSSCGMLVGKGKAGLFCFGCQRRTLLCLDPHYIQDAFRSLTKRGQRKGKCITLPAEDVEPSVLLSFLIRSENDFNQLCESLSGINARLPLPLIPIR